jgi:hypothetical protein
MSIRNGSNGSVWPCDLCDRRSNAGPPGQIPARGSSRASSLSLGINLRLRLTTFSTVGFNERCVVREGVVLFLPIRGAPTGPKGRIYG